MSFMISASVIGSQRNNSTAILLAQPFSSSVRCDRTITASTFKAMKNPSGRRKLTTEEQAEAVRLKEVYAQRKAEAKAAGDKLTQSILAELCGWEGQAIVSHYLNGAIPLNVDALLRLCRALDVDARKISARLTSYMNGEGETVSEGASNVESAPTFEFSRYPVISWVAAGSFSEATEAYSVYDCEHLATDYRAAGNAFWLRVRGESMSAPVGPTVPDGTLILVDPGLEPLIGDLVIARLDDANEATFKKLVEDAGRMYLKSLNPAYPIIPASAGCKIVGVVTETKQKLR